MAIYSTPFGPTILTGEDAEKFRRQFTYGRPNKAARETMARGRELLKEMNENGFAIVRIKRK